jgi:carbon storage regulator
MLVLTRKPDQSIIINDNVVISVLAVDGDRVKIGITAPPSVSILREEVQRAVVGENQRARDAAQNRAGLEQTLRTIGKRLPM